MGKLMHWSYHSDLADAIVSITERYKAAGKISDQERVNTYRKLAQTLNLPELNPKPKYYRPLHPYLRGLLREKTVQALGGQRAAEDKLKEARAKKARAAVKLTVVGGTAKVA